MKKILIWVLVPILLSVVCIMGTLAYLTAVDEEKNEVTVGAARIELREYERDEIEEKNTADIMKFENDKLLIPSVVSDDFTYPAPAYNTTPTDNYVIWNDDHEGEDIIVDGKTGYQTPIWNPDDITNEIDKMVFVKNTGNCNVYVRICFAFEAGNYVWKSHFDKMVHLNKNETDWTWTWDKTGDKVNLYDIDGTRYFIAWATYKHVLPEGEHTNISLSQIALDFSAINDHARAFGEKYEVKAFAQGIQSDGFESANAALAKGFDDTIPFKNVKFVEFVDLPNALHYLNGDPSGTGFVGSDKYPNTRVSSITFGLTADHAEKVKGYDGTLVANRKDDADFTAYAYYIPNSDGQYDIYVLADAWEIYAPWDCRRLFADMAGVKKIDTTNLNVSQTQNMGEWFNRCYALETIDVSDWDVSNVTDMEYLFKECYKLANIDVSDWDVSNVTDMKFMFKDCPITTIDVADWDVSEVTDMGQMFRGCSNLTELDLNSWDTGKLTSMTSIFNACGSLTTLNISKWDVSKVTNMSHAFVSCKSLTSVDIADWDVSSVTEMAKMFQSCFALVELDLSKWNTGNVKDMSNMFDSCHSLASLDLSGWDTGNVKNMAIMFGSCKALSFLKLPANVSAVTDMSKMFYQCRELTELDLSAWDITKEDGTKINMEQMFYMGTNSNVGKLKTIYVGEGWDPTYIGSSSEMFFNSVELPGYSASAVDASKAHTGSDGYLTYKEPPADATT